MKRTEWAFALLLAVTFAPGLLALARVWASVEYYSHGFLVPLVSAWFAYAARAERAVLQRSRDARGAVLLAVALAAYLLGLLVGSASGQGIALVGAVAGAIWMLRGMRWLRALAFPVGFLVFMVPVPSAWLTPGILELQLFVSRTAVGLLQGVGVPVAREGNVLLLPEGETLFVDEACSGVTSVVTLAPLAVLIAYLLRLAPTRAGVLVAAVVPVAMAANLLRVVGTVLAALPLGVAVVTGGTVHTAAGLAVYVVGCLLLVALGRALARRPAAL